MYTQCKLSLKIFSRIKAINCITFFCHSRHCLNVGAFYRLTLLKKSYYSVLYYEVSRVSTTDNAMFVVVEDYTQTMYVNPSRKVNYHNNLD